VRGARQEREGREGHPAHEQLLGVPRRHRDDGRRLSAVVAVDLAARRTRDVGVAVLARTAQGVYCQLVRGLAAEIGAVPEPDALASWLVDLAWRAGASRIGIDGPQAWKDPANGLPHQRVCEKVLATQAKTGVPGTAKPATQLRFVALSIALFDALSRRGFPRFDPARPRLRAAIEMFPSACWRVLGAERLPAKKRCAAAELSRCADFLAGERGVRFSAAPDHDELQAAVAGLVLTGTCWRAVGRPAYEIDGSWREGVIVVPGPANSSR
jgi:hypothetical protein